MVLKFNKEFIDNHYIEIYERIYSEPVLMPKLITKNTGRDIINISYQLVFKFQDVEVPHDVIKVKNNLRNEIRVFEEKALEEFDSSKAEDIIFKFHEEKLMEFLEIYPEYKGVVMDEGISSKVLKFFKP